MLEGKNQIRFCGKFIVLLLKNFRSFWCLQNKLYVIHETLPSCSNCFSSLIESGLSRAIAPVHAPWGQHHHPAVMAPSWFELLKDQGPSTFLSSRPQTQNGKNNFISLHPSVVSVVRRDFHRQSVGSSSQNPVRQVLLSHFRGEVMTHRKGEGAHVYWQPVLDTVLRVSMCIT